MNPLLLAESLVALYNQGGPYTTEQLSAVYCADITFTDPAHSIAGLPALCAYLNHQYGNVQSCHFALAGTWLSGDTLFIEWEMAVRHPALKGGQTIKVNGLSRLQYRTSAENISQVFLHRDYFDLGQLLYENVPVIGAINRQLKKGLTR
ncbi:MAG: nuclear transport factor 2 family protein [Cellvibrionales bacterium]|nr:nuclear transport factor 2 family protein [Cellvibrionales bacterium]